MKRLLSGVLTIMVGAVSVACLPGMNDALAERISPRLLAWLPEALRWGLADAVPLPKMALVWVMTPLVLGAAVLCGRSGRDWQRGGAVMAIIYAALVALSADTSMVESMSVEPAATVLCIVAVAVAASWALERLELERVLWAGAAVGAVVAGYALGQHLGWDPLSWAPPELVRERSIGTLGNPNFLAAWLVMLLPLALHRAATAPGTGSRAAWGGAAGLMGAAVLLSYTRGAWVAMVAQAAVAVIAFRMRPAARWGSREGMVGLAIVGVASVLCVRFAGYAPSTITLSERAVHTISPTDASSVARLALWREALRVARDRPLLGAGPGTFTLAAMPYRADEPPWLKVRLAVPGDPHNELLGVISGSGVVAGGLLVVLTGSVLGLCWRGREAAAPWMLTALVGGAVAHFFVQATVPALLVGWLLAAWALAGTNSGGAGPVRGRGFIAVVGGISLGVAGFAALTSARLMQGDLDFNMGLQMGHEAMREAGQSGAAELAQALDRYRSAQQELYGVRRARAWQQEGKLREELYSRSTPAMRSGAQAALWREVSGQGLRAYHKAIVDNPLDPFPWEDLARFLMRVAVMGRVTGREPLAPTLAAAALEASQKGCDLDPYNAAFWADHAGRCVLAGREADAERAYRRSLELCPDQPAVHLDFGRFLLGRGQTGEARHQFEESLREAAGLGSAGENVARAAREALQPTVPAPRERRGSGS